MIRRGRYDSGGHAGELSCFVIFWTFTNTNCSKCNSDDILLFLTISGHFVLTSDFSLLVVGLNCPRLTCNLNCPYGYVTDSNNCPTCQCLTDNVAQQLVRSNFCPGHWPCLYICPDGYETGPGGCNTCACRDGPLKQQGCSTVGCSLYCNVTGYLRTSDGCPTCQCRGQCNSPSCPSSCPRGIHQHQGFQRLRYLLLRFLSLSGLPTPVSE